MDQIVYAKTDTKAGSKGITAFVIEKGMAGYVNSQSCLTKLKLTSYDQSVSTLNPFVIVVALQIQYCSEIGQTGNARKRYVIPIFSG